MEEKNISIYKKFTKQLSIKHAPASPFLLHPFSLGVTTVGPPFLEYLLFLILPGLNMSQDLV